MGAAERIRDFRLKSGRTENEMANELGLTIDWYCDLEQYDDELETTLSITQALTLARLLGTDVTELLGESKQPVPVKIPAIRAVLVAQLSDSPETREALEDEINWDLGPFLDGADEWMTVYTLDFIRSLATVMGAEWGSVLAGLSADRPGSNGKAGQS
jgi:transcriptional regulator with XRE-family HTH domain